MTCYFLPVSMLPTLPSQHMATSNTHNSPYKYSSVRYKIERVLAGITLVISAPMLLLICCVVKLSSRGPAICSSDSVCMSKKSLFTSSALSFRMQKLHPMHGLVTTETQGTQRSASCCVGVISTSFSNWLICSERNGFRTSVSRTAVDRV